MHVKNNFYIPILFITFNRPHLTMQVFAAIRKARPKQLFIAADGARKGKNEDINKCKKTREIVQKIDWPCEVKTLFQDENLGCKYNVSGAINWFFENVEMGIILEDDCLPSQSFFKFCAELLEKYKDDNRIMLISGFNKQDKWRASEEDYFFSNLGGIWGWASWKRAWNLYDLEMSLLEKSIKNNSLIHLLGKKLGKIREEQLNKCKKENIDTWDYQWGFTRHINSGLSCVPTKNLIKNIGFGIDATHTTTKQYSDSETYELELPLKENFFIIADKEYDALYFPNSSLKMKIKRIIGMVFKKK